MQFFFLILLLLLTPACASLWPWMYAARVVEESSQSEEVQDNYQSFDKLQVKRVKQIKGNFVTRVIGRTEKGFDYNQDGQISPEERQFFLKMRSTREQEKFLRGEQ